jgi:hypothetical protein
VGCAINQDSALPGGVQAPEVESEIISSKQLYQQFMRLVEGNSLNFITQAQANRGNQMQGFKQGGGHNDDDSS